MPASFSALIGFYTSLTIGWAHRSDQLVEFILSQNQSFQSPDIAAMPAQ
jgi:hypothetical protein